MENFRFTFYYEKVNGLKIVICKVCITKIHCVVNASDKGLCILDCLRRLRFNHIKFCQMMTQGVLIELS